MIQHILDCCAGIDVHRKVVVVTLLKVQANGSFSHETRSFDAFHDSLHKMARWLKHHNAEEVAMESTGVYWKPVFECLEEHQLDAMVVNARHVKKVPSRKTDVTDSEWLAELLCCGLLRPSFIPPRDLRELRMWGRYRRKLRGALASEKQRLHKVLDDAGIKLGAVLSDIDGVSARVMIQALLEGQASPKEMAQEARGRLKKKTKELEVSLTGGLKDRHRYLIEKINQHIDWLKNDIHEFDRQIVAAMDPYKQEWELLQSIPGIDERAAAVLLMEIGVKMECFGTAARLSSWAGMCPGNNQSAGKKRSGRCPKGNNHLKTLLCEIANSAVKSECQFKSFYQGLVIRRGHKRAIIAVGHKLLKIVFHVIKDKQPYRDPQINYEALVVARNAPRWLRALKRYGHI